METIFNMIAQKENDNKFEENLFVKNIIVKKDKGGLPVLTYVSTERWLGQLGKRLETSC